MGSERANRLCGLAFPAMEAVSAAFASGSASRSRASSGKGLPARLSGAGMERLSRHAPSLQYPRARYHVRTELLERPAQQTLEARALSPRCGRPFRGCFVTTPPGAAHTT